MALPDSYPYNLIARPVPQPLLWRNTPLIELHMFSCAGLYQVIVQVNSFQVPLGMDVHDMYMAICVLPTQPALPLQTDLCC